MNNYIYLNNKLFEITKRKSSDIKFQSKSRTINGTLKIDTSNTIKKKWNFEFDNNERQLARLYSIFELSSALSLVDSDEESYSSVACVSEEFVPEHVIRNNVDYFIISLDFEEI